MMTGHRTTLKAGKTNYKVLRKINPGAVILADIFIISCSLDDFGSKKYILQVKSFNLLSIFC
jgi:hypothetical protein